MKFGDTLWAVRCIWLRYFDVYRKNLVYAVTTTFVEPILYLLSFGFGMGAMIGTLHTAGGEISYRKFVLAGIFAQAILFQGFFDGAYGSFVRMYYQKIFKAMATTPITLSEVLWGELLWGASKGTFSASVVLLIGCIIGDFSIPGALLCVPLAFLSALIFTGLGMWVSALSNTIEQISYPQYLLVFPMFLFCGVYFPIERLPGFLQTAAWFLPLTPVLDLARHLVVQQPLHLQSPFLIVGWLAFLLYGSRRAMRLRLVK